MKMLDQTVIDVLVTPPEDYEGRSYFNFALQLESGEVFAIGRGDLGVTVVSPAELSTEGWMSAPEFQHLKGKVIESLLEGFGKYEPYVLFRDGTTLHVTGEECGDVVDVDCLEQIRLTKPWLIKKWRRIPEIT